jgi:hypothetical protein
LQNNGPLREDIRTNERIQQTTEIPKIEGLIDSIDRFKHSHTRSFEINHNDVDRRNPTILPELQQF